MEKGWVWGKTVGFLYHTFIFISYPYTEFQWKSQLAVAEPKVKTGNAAAKKRGINPGLLIQVYLSRFILEFPPRDGFDEGASLGFDAQLPKPGLAKPQLGFCKEQLRENLSSHFFSVRFKRAGAFPRQDLVFPVFSCPRSIPKIPIKHLPLWLNGC